MNPSQESRSEVPGVVAHTFYHFITELKEAEASYPCKFDACQFCIAYFKPDKAT